MAPRSGLLPVAGGFSQMISAGRTKDATGARGKRRQFRLKIAIDESYGPPQARRALAVARLADIVAMRDALVAVGRGAQAEFLMRKAGAVASDEEKFQFAIAAANVVMSRPSEKQSEASARFVTWGQLARAWGSQELARLYPNAGYGKKSAEATDEPRIEYLCKFIENVPLASFNDDDYWRAMRPARARCRTDSTFKAYAQVCRRVLKIAVELRIIPAWPLSAVCKLPIVAKGEAPEFPFLYPEEYCRLMRCAEVPIEWRCLWGFIIREGLRLGEAFRIRWEHLAELPPQPGMPARWVLNVPETKTGRALMFLLNRGTGEVLEALRRLRPDTAGPFVWLTPTNLKKAAETLRGHIEQSGTTRERLLFTEGRLRRLREHDLRSTFVSWCKLAGIDNETIAQHTGHESSAMIARYNRSKATIEHLGLAPYLPLDQAMGLGAEGDLRELGAVQVQALDDPARGARGARGAGGAGAPRQLGPGGVPSRAQSMAAEGTPRNVLTSPEAASAEAGAAPAGITPPSSAAPAEAPSAPECPECRRPMARVAGPRGRGWTCLLCNAAGEPEGDWLALVGSSFATSNEGEPLTAEGCPECGMRSPPDRAHAPGCSRGAGGDAGDELEPGEYHAQGEVPAAVLEAVVALYRASRNTQRPAPAIDGAGPDTSPRGAGAAVSVLSPAGEKTKALNSCNPRDPGCDRVAVGAGLPVPQSEETSMNDASCARRDSNPHARGRRNLNPAFGDRRKQTRGESGGEPVPETTGTSPGSHPGVTTPAGETGTPEGRAAPASPVPPTLLEQLQAAHRRASEDRNWTAARALEPLIDAEVARLAEAARAAPPEPVRLEVVRARREGGQP